MHTCTVCIWYYVHTFFLNTYTTHTHYIYICMYIQNEYNMYITLLYIYILYEYTISKLKHIIIIWRWLYIYMLHTHIYIDIYLCVCPTIFPLNPNKMDKYHVPVIFLTISPGSLWDHGVCQKPAPPSVPEHVSPRLGNLVGVRALAGPNQSTRCCWSGVDIQLSRLDHGHCPCFSVKSQWFVGKFLMLVKFKSNRLGAWYDVMIYHACCQVTSDVNLELNWLCTLIMC
jgi:hypothetical protein